MKIDQGQSQSTSERPVLENVDFPHIEAMLEDIKEGNVSLAKD
jgi:hypothetical protein